MKYITIVISLMIVGCTTNATTDQPKLAKGTVVKYENTQTGINSIISKKALNSYKKEYLSASGHKAFAQSLSGVWSWRSNRTTAEHAKTSALVVCQRSNIKNEELYPCKIINVDGVWVNQ
ncbi:MAG: hypothetical protein AB2598_01610 [Candidatus Thiodiazotropha sp.]